MHFLFGCMTVGTPADDSEELVFALQPTIQLMALTGTALLSRIS
jgi:hypothetical protein